MRDPRVSRSGWVLALAIAAFFGLLALAEARGLIRVLRRPAPGRSA